LFGFGRLLSEAIFVVATLDRVLLIQEAPMPAQQPMGDFSQDAQLVEAARGGERDALAAFDYGYLIETYRQLDMAFRMSRDEKHRGDWVNPATGLNGYVWVKKAISIRAGDAEMEFAAALITTENSKQDYQGHVAKAKAGMKEDRLLAENVGSHF
jgi:hypothetical protein